jgi:hypothetical protein
MSGMRELLTFSPRIAEKDAPNSVIAVKIQHGRKKGEEQIAGIVPADFG